MYSVCYNELCPWKCLSKDNVETSIDSESTPKVGGFCRVVGLAVLNHGLEVLVEHLLVNVQVGVDFAHHGTQV